MEEKSRELDAEGRKGLASPGEKKEHVPGANELKYNINFLFVFGPLDVASDKQRNGLPSLFPRLLYNPEQIACYGLMAEEEALKYLMYYLTAVAKLAYLSNDDRQFFQVDLVQRVKNSAKDVS